MEDSAKTVRRNKKVAGVDDPIVIIQRFLNIFRQLHIMSDEQKEDFNNMILQQPPEIRHMCSVLPGGSLLQEYVDELEESKGIAPDQKLNITTASDVDETSEEKTILSSAIEDSSSKESPQEEHSPQEMSGGNSINENMQQQMLLMMQNMQQNMAQAQATISTDPAFAKEIASAISSALAASDEKRLKETQELTKNITESQMQMTKALVEEIAKGNRLIPTPAAPVSPAPIINSDGQNVRIIDNTQEITKAITESQLEMAKMFLQHNSIAASNANNANNIQINNTPANFNHHELVGDIIKAQSQLFREMAQTQTKEISNIISVALRESSELSHKHLIDALSAFQKENLNFLKEQAKNQNHPVIQYAVPPADNTVYEYVEQEVPVQETPKNDASSYIKKVFGNVFNRTHKEENAVSDNSLNDNLSEQQASFSEEQNISETPQDFSEKENDADSFEVPQNNTELYSISNDGLGLSNADIATKKKKKKKKKNKNKTFSEENENTSVYTPIYAEDNTQDANEILDFEPNNQASNMDTFGLDASLFDLDIPADNAKTENISDEENDTFPKLDMSIFDDEKTKDENLLFTEDTPVSSDADDIQNLVVTPSQEISDDNTFSHDDTIAESFSDENINDMALSDSDVSNNDSFIISDSEQNESPIDNSEKEDLQEVENVNEIHENIDVEDKKEASMHSSFIPDLGDQSTVDALMSQHDFSPNSDQIIDLDADYKIDLEQNEKESQTFDSNTHQDWEWEYEETDEDVPVVSADGVESSEVVDDSSQDWEWEYEESNEDVPNISADGAESSEVVDDNSQDWEWEYEETDEDVPAVSADGAESSQVVDDNSQDWEWEYEETDEDVPAVSADGAESSQVVDDNSQDWEWEYEETDEDVPAVNADGAESSEVVDDNSQDWEWEYEETDEDVPNVSADGAESSQVVDDNSQDWEWEYEETDEDAIDSKLETPTLETDEISSLSENIPEPQHISTLGNDDDILLSDDLDLSYLHYDENSSANNPDVVITDLNDDDNPNNTNSDLKQ